jgi:hypothetical protein
MVGTTRSTRTIWNRVWRSVDIRIPAEADKPEGPQNVSSQRSIRTPEFGQTRDAEVRRRGSVSTARPRLERVVKDVCLRLVGGRATVGGIQSRQVGLRTRERHKLSVPAMLAMLAMLSLVRPRLL